ncbi:MAG: DUF4230 domain-containing protein [Bacteroides sp.]|nr:DUF4230 domain-containing protein [Bacteroides sp.]
MSRIKSFACIMTVALAMLGFSCGREAEEQPRQINIVSTLRDTGRLEVAQMSIGKVGMVSDPSFRKSEGFMAKAGALLDKIKVGDRIAVYSYDTYLHASIDLTDLSEEDVSVDEENKTVELRLPPVDVAYDGRDITLREEHYRVNGLRSQISSQERAALKEQMNTEVKRELASDKELTERLRNIGERRAKIFFASLLSDMGYEAHISFK